MYKQEYKVNPAKYSEEFNVLGSWLPYEFRTIDRIHLLIKAREYQSNLAPTKRYWKPRHLASDCGLERQKVCTNSEWLSNALCVIEDPYGEQTRTSYLNPHYCHYDSLDIDPTNRKKHVEDYLKHGHSISRIAKTLNLSRKALSEYLNYHGMDTETQRIYHQHRFRRTIATLNQVYDYPQSDLARACGVDETTISKWIRSVDVSEVVSHRGCDWY